MKDKNSKHNLEISATPIVGQPENAFELINKYGTYNIQPTADSDNQYPTIAHGYPKNGDCSCGFPEARGDDATRKRAAAKGDHSAQELESSGQYTDKT